MHNTNERLNDITVDIKGLKCDDVACSYADMTIKVEDYGDYINKPCPKCGTPLLTQEGYDQVQQLLSLVAAINDMPATSESENGSAATIELGMNDTGDAAIMRIYPVGPDNKGGKSNGEN